MVEMSFEKEYKTIYGEFQTEIEINKSRFITSIKRSNSEEESLAFIEEINKKYRDATHNCTAYINGPTKLIQRYNDDGEPQGTAGIPMLEVLKKEDFTDVVVVVTRYFGGKKLGASGLIRAYGKGVSDAISVSDIVWLRNFYEVKVEFDYTFLGKIDNFIGKEMYHLKEREYLEKIHNTFYIRVDDYEKFKDELLEITSDNIDIEIIRDLQIQVKGDELIY